MLYRKLGESDITISAIAFGAWAAGGWMWGGTDQKEAVRAIHKSIDLGVTTIDTAPVYGFGLSEEIVGEAIKGLRKDMRILTKFGLSWNGKAGEFYFKSKNNQGGDTDIYKYSGAQRILKECEDSLKRLKTDYIDLYQIHWADPTTPLEESFEAVNQLIKQGKVLAAAVCNYTIEQMQEAEKSVYIASNQMPYSMVNRGIEKELVPYCMENKKSILAYSPLQRGLLTGKITENHTFSEGDHRPSTPMFKPENIKKTNDFLNRIKPIAQEKNVTLGQLVINWTVNQPGITCALVGARNPAQAEQNAKALSFKLNKEEISFINEQLKEL